MSDFDPVKSDIDRLGDSSPRYDGWVVGETDIPHIVANELRRLYESHGDPSLYWLVLRAQEIESL